MTDPQFTAQVVVALDNFKTIVMQQGTPEWREARAGKITASRISDMLAKARVPGEGMRANYLAQLVVERLTGRPMEEGYKSPAMQRGNDVEPSARAAYEFFRGVEVQEIGFVSHPRVELSGASPDGLVNDDGLVQIKCPLPNEHIRTLLGKEIDRGYILQMQWEMACTDRQWCDFVSYHNEFPENLSLHVQRVARDDNMIVEIELAARLFNSEIEAMIKKLNG